MALNVETTNNMTNGLTHTYNLTVDGLAVTAVLTFNGSHGILLCSYDDRSISVRLGSQVEYMREDACRALKSRRVMADMVGEAPYSRKATCRSIANRLDMLVQQGDIEADAAQEVITEVKGKWRGLQTSHDFDRFVSTNLVAKQHLALCKRTDDDFETLIAPALAAAIKEDINTDLEIGAPMMGTANDANIATIAVEKVRSVLAFHDLGECLTFVDGIDVLDETVADLRECLAESDDLASDRWAALLSTNNIVCAALNDRGVPATGLFAANVRALVEYLSAVEAAAAKWQAAGLAWQEKARVPCKPLRFRIIPPPGEGWTRPYAFHKIPVPETRSCVMCDIEAERAASDVEVPATSVKIEKCSDFTSEWKFTHGDVTKESLDTYLRGIAAGEEAK